MAWTIDKDTDIHTEPKESHMTGLSGWIRPAFAGLLSSLVLLALFPPAGAAVEFFPIEEIRAGMRGTGRTVFQGSTVEEFEIEVVDVLRNVRPQGDLILFRALDPRLEHSGIVAGMSGSPVYIDGRLVGAIAFAFSFLKDPIGAITPIGEMAELLDMPVTANPLGGKTTDESRARSQISSAVELAHGATRDADGSNAELFDALWNRFVTGAGGPASPPWPRSRDATESGPAMLSLPVAISGWDPALDPALSKYLEASGFLPVPMAAATVIDGEKGASGVPIEPGQAISIEMVRGDARLAAVGTLTHVDGDRLLALGHPMLQDGPSELPLSTAWIHSVMPSLQLSFKMGSPAQPLGKTLRDGRAGVSGILGEQPDMLPVRVVLQEDGERPRQYRYEVARHHFMTRAFIPWTVTNSFMAAGWSQGEATVESRLTLYLAGGLRVERSDLLFTETPGFNLGTEIALPAGILLLNPFERVRIDSVVVAAHYRHERAEARITRIDAWPRRPEAGENVRIEVTVQPHRSDPVIYQADIAITEAWAGKKLRLAVGGASEIAEWDLDRAPTKYAPRDMAGLTRLIETVPRQGGLIVRLVAEEEGSIVGDADLPPLPPSLRSATRAEGSWSRVRPTSGALLLEQRIEVPYVVRGGEALGLEVKS